MIYFVLGLFSSFLFKLVPFSERKGYTPFKCLKFVCLAVQANQICLPGNSVLGRYLGTGFRPVRLFDMGFPTNHILGGGGGVVAIANQICLPRNLVLEGYLGSGFRPTSSLTWAF